MTAKDLYNRTPKSVEKDLNLLQSAYSNHIPEIDADYFHDYVLTKNEKVTIHILGEFDFDSRRFWRLATVHYDGSPVMIVQNAGREGDDHSARFITDVKMYGGMISYIRSILPPPAIDAIDADEIIDENEDHPALTGFYDHELDGVFERHQ